MRRSLFQRLKAALARVPQQQRTFKPRLESLEDRIVPTSISGTVFNDAAGSGTYSGQPGLAGWTVGLDLNRDGILESNEPTAVTDAQGHYSLDTTGQPLGTGPSSVYYLALSLQNGQGGRWVPTTPVFAIDNPNTEPDAVRNFGVEFQPYGSTAPQGSESLVNVNTAGQQGADPISWQADNGQANGNYAMTPVSADANGDYVIAWATLPQPNSSTDTISARVFNAAGSPLTPELSIGTGTTAGPSGSLMPVMPKVAMAGNGQFAVAWQNGSSINMQMFRVDGTPITGIMSLQSNALDGIATDAVGDVALLYGGKTDRYGAENVMVQRYKPTGAANGNAITVASPRLLDHDSGIAMDASGNFTVGWDDYTNGTGYVYAQRYTSAGKANGSPSIVDQQTSNYSPAFRSLAMNNTGQTVVTWSDTTGTHARVYNSSGSPIGSAVTITSGASPISTAIDGAGTVTFAWTGDTPGGYLYDSGNIHYRQLTTSGQLTPESIVNTTTQGAQVAPGVAATGNGTFVIAWSGNGVGDNAGIFAQHFAGAPQIGSFTASASTVADGDSLTLTASNFTDPNPGATITQVAFYATDSAGNQYLLGYGMDDNGVWTWTFTVNLPPGTYTLVAEAEDSDGTLGEPITLLLTVTASGGTSGGPIGRM
jgi:hypothetical protein